MNNDIDIFYTIRESEDDYERQVTIFVTAKNHLVQTAALQSALSRYIASLRDANIIHEEDSVDYVIRRTASEKGDLAE